MSLLHVCIMDMNVPLYIMYIEAIYLLCIVCVCMYVCIVYLYVWYLYTCICNSYNTSKCAVCVFTAPSPEGGCCENVYGTL